MTPCVEDPVFESPPEPNLKWTAVFVLLLAVTMLRLWVSPLRSSLWLDETGTYWLIKDGLYHAITRARNFPTSPIYLAVALTMHMAGGASEFVLRLPSFAATLLATFLLYRLGSRLLNRGAGLIAALVFSCLPGIGFAASDARPYALAVLVVIASTLMLQRWLESASLRDAFAYVLLAALIPYLHPLFATTFIVHALYALQHFLTHGRVGLQNMLLVALFVVLLLVPMVLYFSPTFANARTHSFAPVPSVEDFFGIFAPELVVSGILLGLVVAVLGSPGIKFDPTPVKRPVRVLLAAWVIMPPLLLFVTSRMTGTGLLVERYYLSMAPGVALLLGWSLNSVKPVWRQTVVLIMLILAVLSPTLRDRRFWTSHGRQDWRGAIRAVNAIVDQKPTTVLFRAGFVESNLVDEYHDQEFRQMLLAPLSIYPLRAGVVLPVPSTLDSRSEDYLELETEEALKAGDHLVYISGGRNAQLEYWLEGRLRAEDFIARSIGDFGSVRVLVFERGSRLSRTP